MKRLGDILATHCFNRIYPGNAISEHGTFEIAYPHLQVPCYKSITNIHTSAVLQPVVLIFLVALDSSLIAYGAQAGSWKLGDYVSAVQVDANKL